MRRVKGHWNVLMQAGGVAIEGYEINLKFLPVHGPESLATSELKLSEAEAGALVSELTRLLEIPLTERPTVPPGWAHGA